MPIPLLPPCRALALAAAISIVPAAVAAQRDTTGALQVTARAQKGGRPVAGAHVELMGLGRAVNTDSAGVARFRNLPPGPLLVQIRKFGYGADRFPVTVVRGDTILVDVDLQSEAVRLAEVRATAQYSPELRNTGFFERRKTGFGAYVTRQEWEGRGRLELSDVVRRMRGIRVAQTSDDVNALVSLFDVEAVETYAGGAATPVQYNATGSSCAVVLIWRRGAA